MFPIDLQFISGIPINRHPGAFGCPRKYDIHTGVDLYTMEGVEVVAITDGIVLKQDIFTGDESTPWWKKTHALLVDHGAFLIVYGEIIPHKNIIEGQKIEKGTVLGTITPVLEPHRKREDIPGHKVSMLHFEMYHKKDYLDTLDGRNRLWSGWFYNKDKPEYLLDPTKLLLDLAPFNINLLHYDP